VGVKPTVSLAPGVLELKGMSEFKPTAAIAASLDAQKESSLNVRFGNLAQGPITVKTAKKGQYRFKKQPIPLSHPLFARAAESLPGLTPSLILTAESEKLTGYIGLVAGTKVEQLDPYLAKGPELLGLAGFKISSLPKVTNQVESGSLHLGLTDVHIRLGSAFDGTFTVAAVDESVTFSGNVAIAVKGLAKGTLDLKRTPDGAVTGKATVGLTLPKNLTGDFEVTWDGRAIDGQGKVGYSGEKLSGEVTLHLMEKSQAEQLEAASKAPEGAVAPATSTTKKNPPAKVEYVVFGDGNLTFAFNEWLNGNAQVIISPLGYLTVIGKITPQKEFILFEQKDYIKPLFKVEIRAAYGIPFLANIFIFASVGMDAFAKLGPGKFYNIVVDGTYSTDPKKANNFSIRGTLNISAAAGLRLGLKAGVGLTLLAHDVKAGAGVNGIAGIQGYAEAMPVIGYREKGKDGEDKKGEFFIRGEIEIAGQPFLGLSGELFVAIDSPWWSPVPDKTWTWPLAGKEWPIGGSFGLNASLDYVFGSKEWPKLDFKTAEFDSTKFMTDLYADKAKSGSGKEEKSKGNWEEENSKSADPPPQPPAAGNAKPGALGTQSTASTKVLSGGGGKGTTSVDSNAKLKDGKTVGQHEEQAAKDGKNPPGLLAIKFPESSFPEGEESHKISIRNEGGHFAVFVSSQTKHLDAFLNEAAKSKLPEDKKKKIGDARKLLEEMNALLAKIEKTTKTGALVTELQKVENELAATIKQILGKIPLSTFNQIYKLEGLVATFKTTPTQTGDNLTPDHQPQAQLLQEVAKLDFFKGTVLQQAAKGHADDGKTINLQKIRHYAGRTYGKSGLVGPAISLIKSETSEAGMGLQEKRKKAITVMKAELGKDVKQIKTEVVGKKNDDKVFADINESGLSEKDKKALIKTVQTQIKDGEDRILKQDFESYAKDG